jgi:hypothetical protein
VLVIRQNGKAVLEKFSRQKIGENAQEIEKRADFPSGAVTNRDFEHMGIEATTLLPKNPLEKMTETWK